MAKRRARGEGSVFKLPDGSWKARLRCGAKVWERRFPSQREALQALEQWRRQAAQGVYLAPGKLTVGQYLEEWLEAERSSWRPTTYANYRFICEKYLIPSLGKLKLEQLTTVHVERLLRELTSSGCSARTANLTRAVLRSALSRAERLRLVERNAAALAAPVQGKSRTPTPFTLEEVEKLCAQAQGHRLEAAFLLGLLRGLRMGEVLGLRWEDVDLQAGVVRVRQQLQRVGKELLLSEPKTAAGRRTVPLPGIVVAALARRKTLQREEQLKAGPSWQGNPEGLVFTSARGTPLEPRNFAREFHGLLDAAGIPRRGFHAARHTAATLLRGMGCRCRT